jgi:hypothetical protein
MLLLAPKPDKQQLPSWQSASPVHAVDLLPRSCYSYTTNCHLLTQGSPASTKTNHTAQHICASATPPTEHLLLLLLLVQCSRAIHAIYLATLPAT